MSVFRSPVKDNCKNVCLTCALTFLQTLTAQTGVRDSAACVGKALYTSDYLQTGHGEILKEGYSFQLSAIFIVMKNKEFDT